MTSFDNELAKDISKFYSDPLGYVMYIFPWSSDKSIQIVKLVEPYKSRFKCEYGPDKWACEFLDDLGKEIKKRNFNGSKSVNAIRFSTSSGHGIGKSALVAWLIKFLLDTRPFSKGVITANTSEQLRTKTWAEVGKWNNLSLTAHLYDYSSGKGSMSLSRKGHKGLWGADALTCREENSEAFQGLHAANSTPFFIFDEASGIPDKIWDARAGGLTDGEPMSFDFGNPTRNLGMFFENCVGKYKDRYIVRCIDSRSVQITNKELFEEWRLDRGEDSDFFKVKVKGIFPSQSSVQFIGRDIVEESIWRNLPTLKSNEPLIIGVDVARFGDDNTVIYPRIGYDAKSFPFKSYNGLNTNQVVEKVIETINEFRGLGKKCSALFVDVGYNPGVLDNLRQLGYNPISVDFGSRASDRTYRFRGDEIWGRMRDGLKFLCLPNDEKLVSQLTQREYGFTDVGKIHLESKKDIKKRGGESPDIADALALTFASEIARDEIMTSHKPLSYTFDYDPLENKKQ